MKKWFLKTKLFFKNLFSQSKNPITVENISPLKPKKVKSKKKKPSALTKNYLKIKNKIKDKQAKFGFKTWVPLSYPYIFLMIFLIVLPLLIVLLYSIIVTTGNSWIFKFTFSNFNDFFADNGFILVLFNSIIYSFFASVLAVIIGYPIAYIMAFKVSKLTSKNIWVLITLPIWINMLLRTIGLEIIFNILGSDVLIGTPIGIILAMTYMFLPFVILPIYNSLEKTDKNLLEASQDLGASPTRTFWKITFRFSLPGVFSGFTLMMLSAMTSLVVVKYIGGGKLTLISNIIESYFYKGANFSLGAAISVVLAIIVFLIIVSLKALGKWATGKKIWG